MYSRSGFGDLTPSLSFTKTSGASPYPAFIVGDSWTATITGPANQPVWLQSSRSGSPMILSQVGMTDSTGRFSLSGTVGTGEIGSWVETWYVGGINVGGATLTNATSLGTITFSVSAAPHTSADATNTTPPVPPMILPPVMSGGFPSWVWIAGVGVLAFSLLGGRR